MVCKYLRLTQAAGLNWPLPEEWNDHDIERRLFPPVVKTFAPRAHKEPDFAAIYQELKRKGVTRQLLWEEYRQAHPEGSYRYAQFCQRCHDWKDRLQRSPKTSAHDAPESMLTMAGIRTGCATWRKVLLNSRRF